MAQATWVQVSEPDPHYEVTIVFDTPESNVLTEAFKADPGFLIASIEEALVLQARAHNQRVIEQKIAEIRAPGTFGKLGMILA